MGTKGGWRGEGKWGVKEDGEVEEGREVKESGE